MSSRRRLAVSVVVAAAVAATVPLFVGSGTSGAAPAPAGCPSNPSYDFTILTPVGPPTATSLSPDNFATTAYAALGADKKLYYVESRIDGHLPLACLAPFGVDTSGAKTAADAKAAKLSPGNGKLASMPKDKVLG